jgi:uncharacterized PurR-regulated membrane protein YhhQ (DUF165 family)
MNMMKYKLTVAYIVAIVIANLGFSYLPMIPLPGGEMLAPMSFLVGFIFVIRDFSQREIGHKVLGAMAVGGLLSYYMADPFVAYASVVAFMISESVDWGVYTFTNKPLKQRVLLSSLIGTPIDSAIFMSILGFFSWYGLLIMFISKMVGALIVWRMLGKENDSLSWNSSNSS